MLPVTFGVPSDHYSWVNVGGSVGFADGMVITDCAVRVLWAAAPQERLFIITCAAAHYCCAPCVSPFRERPKGAKRNPKGSPCHASATEPPTFTVARSQSGISPIFSENPALFPSSPEISKNPELTKYANFLTEFPDFLTNTEHFLAQHFALDFLLYSMLSLQNFFINEKIDLSSDICMKISIFLF